jgi:hypothetical protein
MPALEPTVITGGRSPVETGKSPMAGDPGACHTLAMAVGVPGALVGTGRSADVYDLGNGRVLRRYRDRREPGRVAAEAEVMVRARAFGVPVPEVTS